MCPSGVSSSASCLFEDIGDWFPCLCFGMSCLKWPLLTSIFSLVEKDTGSFTLYHDQTASLLNQCLAQETDESGGHESKVVDNDVCQTVPHL